MRDAALQAPSPWGGGLGRGCSDRNLCSEGTSLSPALSPGEREQNGPLLASPAAANKPVVL